jgi:integrase
VARIPTPALPAEVAAAIASYSPRLVGAPAAALAQAAVSAAAPPSVERAKALLYATSRLAAFATSVGLEASVEVCLRSGVVERFLASISGEVSAATRRTLATNLRHVVAALNPGPSPARMSRERAKLPYRAFELAAYLALAETQPTPRRHMRAVGLICLGAGAGLTGADLRAVRGVDVLSRSGGVVVEVSGTRARVVPVLASYHRRVLQVAEYFGGGFIVGGIEASRRNVTTALISSLAGGADLPRLDVGRLRCTWLAEVAATIGLGAFMEAAGISCSQRLGDVVAALERPDEAAAVAILGGRAATGAP